MIKTNDQDIKKQYYSTMNEWFREQRMNYFMYFATYTFHDSNHQIMKNSHIWFERHVERINNELLTKSKHYQESVVLILYPEIDSKFGRLHYHGIFLIHNNTKDRFYDRIFNGSSNKLSIKEREDKLKQERKSGSNNPYYSFFCDKVMQPFIQFEAGFTRKLMYIFHKPKKEQKEQLLNIKDYRFYPLSKVDDLYRTHSYSHKTFYDFEYDDLMVFTKLPKNKRDKMYALKRKASAQPTKRNIKNYKYYHENNLENCHLNAHET